jgi:hypothetical protein
LTVWVQQAGTWVLAQKVLAHQEEVLGQVLGHSEDRKV